MAHHTTLFMRRFKKSLKVLSEEGPRELIKRIKVVMRSYWRNELPTKTLKTLEYDTSPVHFIGRKLNQEGLERALGKLREKPFVLAFSQDNYLKVIGGVQLKIADQQREMNDKGLSYLHLSPFKARTTLDFSNKPGVMNLNLDGQFVGYIDDETLLSAFKSLAEAGTLKEIVIHHLMGWKLNYVEQLLTLAKNVPVRFWLHDFFSVCPNYTLLRNDREYCHAPEPYSNACQLCIYGTIRPLHYQAFSDLFRQFPIHVVAPSEFALEFWREKFPLVANEGYVVPNAILEWQGRLQDTCENRPLRIAFVGYPVLHKGWQAWLRLSNQFGKDSRYKFFHFSSDWQPSPNFEKVSVKVTQKNRSAMIDVLSNKKIDIAFLWSICPETFSFTLYEALAAGCYIVTNSASGNIQDTILRNPQWGKIYASEIELLEAFEEGCILQDFKHFNESDRRTGRLILAKDDVQK
jgi:glycosyltransferase involved in cell wall biosynthesis